MRTDLDLLEDLRKKVKCAYISDMRYSYQNIARKEFEKMDLSQYPNEMYKDAFHYLYKEE